MLSLSLWLAGYWMRRSRLTQTETPITRKQRAKGRGNPRPKRTPATAAAWPDDGEPAQADERVEAQVPGVMRQALLVDLGHPRTE